jgi:hypothetical protein
MRKVHPPSFELPPSSVTRPRLPASALPFVRSVESGESPPKRSAFFLRSAATSGSVAGCGAAGTSLGFGAFPDMRACSDAAPAASRFAAALTAGARVLTVPSTSMPVAAAPLVPAAPASTAAAPPGSATAAGIKRASAFLGPRSEKPALGHRASALGCCRTFTDRCSARADLGSGRALGCDSPASLGGGLTCFCCGCSLEAHDVP